MSKQGQYNYTGINAQAWAAMSLFLQFLRDPKFSAIQLEAENFEDFNLVFNDGKKIVCESKDRKEAFSYPHLKELLENISRKDTLGSNDEVLIICTNVNRQLKSDVRHVKYFEQLQKKFLDKGYSKSLFSLLPKVRFWVISPSVNEKVIYALFSELINFWLPAEDLKRIVDSILLQNIYKGSAAGAIYSRTDIILKIEELTKEVRENSVYGKNFGKREKQFRELEKALSKPRHPIWKISKELSEFSTDFERLVFAKDRLEKKQNELVLQNWDPVWQLYGVRFFTFAIFKIFQNNLHSEANRRYVLGYIKKYTGVIRGFYQTDFFDIDVVRIVTRIIESEKGQKYLNDAFEIVRGLILKRGDEFFYLKNAGPSHDEWEKEEICKLLHKIYNKAELPLRQKIFTLLINSFNITEDDGEFNWHAPKEVYVIIKEWLDEDFLKRFNVLVTIIADQYARYYKKFGGRITFSGWEHMGGGTSFGPGGYHVGDRHFISKILAPSLEKYYEQNRERGWEFIKKYCITPDTKVDIKRPDFLNRAVCNIILSRYVAGDKKTSEGAFKILKEFIQSKKGIPHKSDLIYQLIANNNIPDEKKWNLVALTVAKYDSPVNPFAEQIVANLARKGYDEAKKILRKWLANQEYYDRSIRDNSISSIRASLDSDFDFAVELFKTLIRSEHIKKGKSDHFSAYNVAVLLFDIFKKDYATGLSIIRELEAEEALSDDQQIIYVYSLFSYQGNDDSDNAEILLRIYKEVVDPFLTKFQNDISKICTRISNAHCRDGLVQFAVRLAVKKNIAEAIRIIRVFINDPDPYLPGGNDPEDQEDKYNEHKSIAGGEEPHSITSVRGWCGWALMKCSVLAGRDNIPEIIKLSKQLVEDENYYAIHMGTFALSHLAANRLTVLPENKEVLFFSDNKKTALERSKNVEDIAFKLLKRFAGWPEPVQKAMAQSIVHVFDPIRALNKEKTLELLNAFSKLSSKNAIVEAAPFFLFYAELRAGAYKDWRFSLPGLYDDLKITEKDAQEFKEITLGVIRRLQKEDPDSCFKFAASAEHLMREGWKDNEEQKKYTETALEYFGLLTDIYAHNIFNIVYKVIEDKLRANDSDLESWYKLLVKCFGVEEKFYRAQIDAGKQRDVYWYPSLYHSEILELIYEKLGNEKFMQVAKIFFLGFPKEIDLHESGTLVSIVLELAKTDKMAKEIIVKLKGRNPSKYWELNKGKNE